MRELLNQVQVQDDGSWSAIAAPIQDSDAESFNGKLSPVQASSSLRRMPSQVSIDEASASTAMPNQEGFSIHASGTLKVDGPCSLHQLVDNMIDDKWDPVVGRIFSNPEQIAMKDSNGGNTALHASCIRYPPVEVVENMLVKNKNAALTQNFSGETPLHIACYGASEDVQRVLIQACPEAASVADTYGDLPLHTVARAGSTPTLIEELLIACPEAVTYANHRGVTPFWLLPRSYLGAENLEDILNEEADDDFLHDWNLLVLFLRYAYFGERAAYVSKQEINDYAAWIVHAAASTPSCPLDVLKFLCRLFPSSACRRNEQGMTPLLLATQAPEMKDPKAWDEGEDGVREQMEVNERMPENRPLSPGRTALTRGDIDFLQSALVEESFEETPIDVLIKWNALSVLQKDPQGRLPLALALVSGKSWKVVRKLIAACPLALEIRDRPSHLSMYKLAAMHSPQLDTVYSMVRSLPELLSSFRRMVNNDEES